MKTRADTPPRSVRAQRVLLWVVAVITWMNAWVTLLDSAGGGVFQAVGYALPETALGAVCAVLAVRLRTRMRWVRVGVIAVHVVVLIGELARLGGGDPLALIGLLFPIAGLVLIFQRGSRKFLTERRERRRRRPRRS
ncbi:peptidoglycan/LPS O-acetylase OafA/YrhL [Spinactinospora alkalitolerans]|uniref:Peptidoglycan/LPS O-acetylase OafA/YrhL n=1 Tax=Spinactinospora alkalitolerans TaxID=687207 RepID=A0A852TNN0_9ACTN|nr:hypothetical protein [Spinactinospora alkalitolerans]NYE45558.1 peptidoglycan/LPS O-acetylase OafA/YrhL [Spinactinospora alkalitolerans]